MLKDAKDYEHLFSNDIMQPFNSKYFLTFDDSKKMLILVNSDKQEAK